MVTEIELSDHYGIDLVRRRADRDVEIVFSGIEINGICGEERDDRDSGGPTRGIREGRNDLLQGGLRIRQIRIGLQGKEDHPILDAVGSLIRMVEGKGVRLRIASNQGESSQCHITPPLPDVQFGRE